MAYVRTVKTASGARAVQIVHSSRRGSRDIEHIGSAHDDAALEALKAVARQRLAVGQPELDFGPDFAALQAGSGAGGGPLAITSSRMGYLWDALGHAYQLLGFEEAAGGDEVFRSLVLARIVEPTSKLDAPAPLIWGRRHWFSTMCPPCTSRPMPGTGSVSPGSPKNAAWSRISRSGCSPTQAGFR
ncbi:hypothetical protein GCM10017567_32140 [Amycolatopsis bullii]|uniref:Transposase n=1 Tax=Amycolatopsis bullii TaxID=941987 RepID=A0ABQ3KBC2_9PSEU|nr:hypothetical protein GCM10017567_32140 [Amycolatopsis bullii]